MRNAILRNENRSSFLLNLKYIPAPQWSLRSLNSCSVGYDDHNETLAPIKFSRVQQTAGRPDRNREHV